MASHASQSESIFGGNMKLTIEFYGSLREASKGNKIQVDLPEGTFVKVAKEAIFNELESIGFLKSSLVMDSALASDKEILQDDIKLTHGGTYSLLPPVCGG